MMQKRGANILAEVVGFDDIRCHRYCEPSKKGAARAMIGALKMQNLIQKMWSISMHMVLEF